MPTSRCPSAFRGNGTKCVLGDYYHSSDGLCCNTILDNPGEFNYLNRVSELSMSLSYMHRIHSMNCFYFKQRVLNIWQEQHLNSQMVTMISAAFQIGKEKVHFRIDYCYIEKSEMRSFNL